jgi:N-sulfoglucosamine sulfohydrolase
MLDCIPLYWCISEGMEKGRNDQLISFVDLAPTVLSLAGIKPPDYMEGNAFLGAFKNKEREVVFATSDRFDEFTDRIRAVRDRQFLYVKNYHTLYQNTKMYLTV